ncbi:hypothetical protein AB4571_02420 [Vibrio breoganii]|uniref:hypothetical protein n=1 Tax=Vibrio breoganii TaxID=553239 RepID=UPI001054B91F|nr:hypothetical protein [Vibrio breoganii]
MDQALAELHESNKVVTKAMLYKTRTSYQIKVLRAHKDHANTLITLIHRVREHDEYTRIYHLAKHSKNVSLSSISLLESLTKQPK